MRSSEARSRQPRSHQQRSVTSEIKLRAWQQDAFGIYLDAISQGERSLLWEATPGAGKTTAALVVALHQMRKNGASCVVVVVPTSHLKTQWARSAVQFGLHLDSSFRSRGGLARDFAGFVVTYQQVAMQPGLFHRIAKNSCVILDEVHHAGEGLSWGVALQSAFQNAQLILCLSGTPFRSDNNPIPFVPYDEDGVSVPQYRYPYSRAVEEGVCRPTAFFTYGGEVAWREDKGELIAQFADHLDPTLSRRRLRVAVDAESGWIDQMLIDANAMLQQVRTDHPAAGALLVAPDQTAARRLAKLISRLTGFTPTVVLSEDAEAARRLKAYRESDDPWLVACNMVSEGVDIPRLRVGVYATTVRTRMYFRQFLGRLVRRMPDLTCLQVAYCYLPADPVLTRFAAEIEDEIRHIIRHRPDGEEEIPDREDRERPEPGARGWQVMESKNSGVDSVIVHGNHLSLVSAPLRAEQMLQVVHENVVARLDERRSLCEQKASLAQEIRKLVAIYHKRSGEPHAHIHSKLNKAQKVKSQTVCTELQLKERVMMLRKMAFG